MNSIHWILYISSQVDVEGIVVENLARRCGGFLKSLSLNGCQVNPWPSLTWSSWPSGGGRLIHVNVRTALQQHRAAQPQKLQETLRQDLPVSCQALQQTPGDVKIIKAMILIAITRFLMSPPAPLSQTTHSVHLHMAVRRWLTINGDYHDNHNDDHNQALVYGCWLP